jgi:hypothetical protein
MPVSASRSRNSKNIKPRGLPVSHPNSRRQRALAAERSRKTKKATALEKEALFFETHYPKLNITQFGTRNAKQYAKFRESAQKRNKAILRSNNTNNKTKLEHLARETLKEFLKLYFEIREKHGDVRGAELEELMGYELENANNNTDILARKSLKKFTTILTNVLDKYPYAIHYNEELEDLMWENISS